LLYLSGMAEARSYKPTPRDMLADMLLGLARDRQNYGVRRFVGNLVGSAGAGKTDRMSLVDWTPLGAALQLHEAGMKLGTPGQRVQGAAEVALGMVPIPAAAKGIRKLTGAKKAAAEAVKPGFTAYHGSPHQFDQFDLSKIGTGEGAQAYGHGLYFAQHEDVARSYRDILSENTGKPDVDGAARLLKSLNGDREKAIATVQHNIASIRDRLAEKGSMHSHWESRLPKEEAMLRALQEGLGQGHMYQVRINADPEQFLDWDAPFPQQSEHVQKAVTSLDHPMVAAWQESGALPHVKGETLYRQMAGGLTRGAARDGIPVGASSALQQAGVPGIKYLDQGSRGAGNGSRNFVVFDPKIVSIMKRYGIAAPTAAALLSAGWEPPPER
jgi:hypothetical protein